MLSSMLSSRMASLASKELSPFSERGMTASEIETRVDPSILGGLKVRVGSRLFDASLKSKLDTLKFALKRA